MLELNLFRCRKCCTVYARTEEQRGFPICHRCTSACDPVVIGTRGDGTAVFVVAPSKKGKDDPKS